LSSHIAPAVKQILKDHLLSPHISDLISMPGSGLDIMIDTEKIDVLSRLYRLYILVPLGLSTLKNALKESIGRRGKAINDASSGPDASEVVEQAEDLKGKGKARAKVQVNSVTPATEWVQRVLELKDQFDNIWEKAFQQNHVLEVSINEVRLFIFWRFSFVFS
jgi:cullin 3